MNRPRAPFVLLDDARRPGGAPARLYRDAVRTVEARTVGEVRPALDAIRAGTAQGLHAAGFLAYEAAAAFEPTLVAPAALPAPLLWFGLFDRYREIAPDEVAALLPDPAGAWNGAPVPELDQTAYDAQFDHVQRMIAAGDLYQTNLTYRATLPIVGDPLSLYARLRQSARAGYGALVDTGAQLLLSFSPELFFALDGSTLTCRPMKGTARRGETRAADRAAIESLTLDPKQRAENLMIVDLMRNDLARVAVAGSVAVPSLFAVESYPSVHQMVSTVTATLAPEHDAIDVLEALFPCGSITGAPKIAAMEAIGAIETSPRGAYTGAIGRIDAGGPDGGGAMFNVAIRTLTLDHGAGQATLGTGGGIVADSLAAAEWDETQAKTDFLTRDRRRFDLIETMAFDPASGLPRLERHLARIAASARTFGFAFDRHAARNELQAATFRLRGPRRVRLVLAASGAIAIEVSPMPDAPADPVTVAIVPLPVDARDFRLAHKTSDRGFYDAGRGGHFEVLFERPDGRLTEGSFTSLFVPRGDILVTPPLTDGLLPGVLRAELIDSGRAIEREVSAADLTHEFFVGNALRGLIRARLAVAEPMPSR